MTDKSQRDYAQQEANRGKWIATALSYILPPLIIIGFISMLLHAVYTIR